MPSGGGEAGRVGRRARLAARLAAAAALCGSLLAASAGSASALAPDLEEAFVARIAAERQAGGRGPLTVAADLVDVARRHSATMAARNRLYHNPGLGTEVGNWLKVGENVGTGATVDNIHAALMESPTHRDEILRPAFTQVGVGAVTGPDGALWVTQIFRLPAAPVEPPPPAAPTPAAAAPTPATPAPDPASGTASRSRTAPPTTTPAAATTAPTTAPTAAPPTTTAPPVRGPVPGEHVPAVALSPPPVVASSASALPLRPGLAGVGSFAAALLWLVTAALVRSLVRPRTRRP